MADLEFNKLVGYGDSRVYGFHSGEVTFCELLESMASGVFCANRGKGGRSLDEMANADYAINIQGCAAAGPNLITNGTFATVIPPWVTSAGVPTTTLDTTGNNSTRMKIENSTTASAAMKNDFTTVASTNYTLFTLHDPGVGGARFYGGSTSGNTDLFLTPITGDAFEDFTATSTLTSISLGNATTPIGRNSFWDSVEVRLTGLPEAAINYGGINDIISGVSGPGDVAAVVAALQADATSLGSQEVADSIHPVFLEDTQFKGNVAWDSDRQDAQDQYNAWLPGFCATNGYTFVATRAALASSGDADIMDSAFSANDDLHLILPGQQQIANLIFQAILFEDPTTQPLASSPIGSFIS